MLPSPAPKPVLAEKPLQIASVDSGGARRERHISAALLEQSLEQLALGGCRRRATNSLEPPAAIRRRDLAFVELRITQRCAGRRDGDIRREQIEVEDGVCRKHGGALDEMPKLAHVARVAVRLERGHRGGGEARPLARGVLVLRKKGFDEERNGVWAGTEGGQVELDDAQTVVEIRTESARPDA